MWYYIFMIKLIDFYAEWCGPCKIIEPIFKVLKSQYKDKVEFVSIDVDKNMKEASKYSVMSIPTFILEKDGKEIDRKTGSMPKEALESLINSNI